MLSKFSMLLIIMQHFKKAQLICSRHPKTSPKKEGLMLMPNAVVSAHNSLIVALLTPNPKFRALSL